MASATFTVEHPRNRRFVIQQDIAEIAGRVAAAASAATPHRTGAMAAGWHTVPGNDPGTTLVVNTVPYARFVEYGTRHMPARAPLGRAAAGAR
jgi:Bacteriophage HK97-gp10, putative tail-component